MTDGILSTGFSIAGVDGTFEPVSVNIRESIHGLRRIEVALTGSPDAAEKLLRKGAQLSVAIGGESVRRFEGRPTGENMFACHRTELAKRDLARDRVGLGGRSEKEIPARDRVAPELFGFAAPVIENAVGIERVPAF